MTPLDSLILAPETASYNIANLTRAIAPGVLCVWGPQIARNISGVIARSAETLKQAQENIGGCLLLMQDRFSAVPHLRKAPLAISNKACEIAQKLQRETLGLFSKFYGPTPYSNDQFHVDRNMNFHSVQNTLLDNGIPKDTADKIAKINDMPAFHVKDARDCFELKGVVSIYLDDTIAAPANGQGLDPEALNHFHQNKRAHKGKLPPVGLITNSGEVHSPDDIPEATGEVMLVAAQSLYVEERQNDR